MKIKYFYFVFLTMIFSIFTSCTKSTKNENTEKSGSNYLVNDTLVKIENPKLLEYREFVNELDSTDILSVEKATLKFKEVFSNQRFGLADSGFVYFQQLMDTLELKLNEKFQADTAKYNAFAAGNVVSKKLINYQKQLYNNGFRIINLSQSAYIEQNRVYTINAFSSILSNEMNYYNAELNTESLEGFATDDSIIISPQKLVDRNVWYDRFIVNYPHFVFIENCKKFRKAYLSYLFQGMSKTPVYLTSSDKKVLSPYFINAYDYLMQNFNDSETAALVGPYFLALKEGQTANSKSILKKYIIQGLIYDLH